MNSCTCETHGHCYPCRYEREMAPYMKKMYCHWCWADITYRQQYTLGHWQDGFKVCGVNCPARPAHKEVPVSMSRKDYDAMAELLVSQRQYMDVNAYHRLCRRIGVMYAKDNPRFDITKWREATTGNDL